MESLNALLAEDGTWTGPCADRRGELRDAIARLEDALMSFDDLRGFSEDISTRYSFRLGHYEDSLKNALDGQDDLEEFFLSAQQLQTAGEEAHLAGQEQRHAQESARLSMERIESILAGWLEAALTPCQETKIEEARNFLRALDGELNRLSSAPLRRNGQGRRRLRHTA
jgi:hypothetical protein